MRILLTLSLAAVAACATTGEPQLDGKNFSALDQNGDGQLSAAELEGTVLNIEDLDSNANGSVSLEEATTYARKNQARVERERVRTNTGSRL